MPKKLTANAANRRMEEGYGLAILKSTITFVKTSDFQEVVPWMEFLHIGIVASTALWRSRKSLRANRGGSGRGDSAIVKKFLYIGQPTVSTYRRTSRRFFAVSKLRC